MPRHFAEPNALYAVNLFSDRGGKSLYEYEHYTLNAMENVLRVRNSPSSTEDKFKYQASKDSEVPSYASHEMCE